MRGEETIQRAKNSPNQRLFYGVLFVTIALSRVFFLQFNGLLFNTMLVLSISSMMKELTSFSVIIAHSASPHGLLARATGLIVSFFFMITPLEGKIKQILLVQYIL